MPRRGSPTPLLTPPVLIILLPIIALLVLFFAITSFLSITSQIYRPHAVKKSWDSFNIFLVLFAILCGIFARRNDDESTTTTTDEGNTATINPSHEDTKQNQPISNNWFDYSDQKIHDPPNSTPATGLTRLKRNSSSYPDLRQDSFWPTGDDKYRFFDDFDIHKYRSLASDDRVPLRKWRSEIDESDIKVIPVDTFVLRSSSPAPPPPPPTPPPPPAVHHKPKRTYQSLGHKEKPKKAGDHIVIDHAENFTPPTPPPPPPPPPPLPRQVQMAHSSEPKKAKSEGRKSNATKEIKMVFTSLYNQRKRKKKQKTKSSSENQSTHEQPYSTTIPPPSPPPPPPPPPPSVFHSLFKKGSKSKKNIPPPPPPPPKRKNQIPPPPPPPVAPPLTPPPEPSRRRTRVTTWRPPLPTRVNNNYDYNVNNGGGGQSRFIPMPPPPPPPPFKMAEMKFVVKGDFVKIRSEHSSRCSSPELEEVDLSSSKESMEAVNVMNGGDVGGGGCGSVFCPSPDVNVKADTFIARLRDEWRLEKMNSMKEKRRMGPAEGPFTI